jgi:hypothetical protein
MVRGMKAMHVLAVGVVAGALGVGGCHHARRAPELSAKPAAVKPKGKNVLQRTGDAAWGVVSAPVRLIVPGKKKPEKKEEPVTYEPAEAVIMMPPGAMESGGAGTRPGQ